MIGDGGCPPYDPLGFMVQDQLGGLRLVSNPQMCDHKQVRFPRSKKRRIRRKWAKNQKNWKDIPQSNYYICNGSIIAHPEIIEQLKEQLKDVRIQQ